MLVPKAIKDSKYDLRKPLKESVCEVNHSSLQPPIVLLPETPTVAPRSNRHEVNPALALKLLRDIERSVQQWQVALRQVIKAIDALHAEGPMVNGWLASSLETMPPAKQASQCTETTLLRHGDPDALMQYVEALESQEIGQIPLATASDLKDSTQQGDRSAAETQYHLCWLNDEGKVCSQACPLEQMAVVSTAIARYQKCKQLLAQQQVLEARLQSTVDGLTDVRSDAQQYR